ncbi:hypothetical protein AeRB84_009487 [Aphanomyces euteiches]|nr:hypothetical protein AeRB84_009487 [Aphanomyces euteiches]
MFNNHQHEIQDKQRDSSYWFDIFHDALTSIGNVVMVMSPWSNPSTLTRMWCVFEVYLSIIAKARFEVALGKTQKEEFLQEIVQGDNAFLRMLASIKSETSRTSVEADHKEDQGGPAWIIRTLESQFTLPTTTPAMQAKSLEAMGSIYFDKSDYSHAKDYFQRAYNICRCLEAFTEMWRVQSKLAMSMASSNDRRSLWEPLFQEALENQQRQLGLHHRDTVATLALYGKYIGEIGDNDRAVKMLSRAYEICQHPSSMDDTLSIECMTLIGRYLIHDKKFMEATQWLEGAYDSSCANLASIVYSHRNRFDDCLKMLQDNYSLFVRTFGADHIDSWCVLSSTGIVYCALGHYEKAVLILIQSRENSSPSLVQTTFGIRDLGKVYYCMGKFVKALKYTEEVLPQLLTLYGTRHDLPFNSLYDFYLLQVATNSFDNLKAVNAFEELLQQANCMDETWKVHPCRGCFKLVCGIRYVCAVCPTESRWHCGNCLGKKPSSFCLTLIVMNLFRQLGISKNNDCICWPKVKIGTNLTSFPNVSSVLQATQRPRSY